MADIINLKPFLVGMTNIFPMANSTTGAQLLTEYNLRSRESVPVGPAGENHIQYMTGPSCTHSVDDLKLSASGSTLTISSGRALINGHYFELIEALSIDLKDVENVPTNTDLCIGIRAMYSDTTLSSSTSLNVKYDSLKAENDDNTVYEGIQLVIASKAEFHTPEDEYSNKANVTAHLKLGETVFDGSIIQKCIQNDDKVKYLDASRIKNLNSGSSGSSGGSTTGDLSRDNLDNKFYVLWGKQDTKTPWCDATGSLMIWDSACREVKDGEDYTPSTYAKFESDIQDNVTLVVPHKQVPNKQSDSNERIIKDARLMLPKANYVTGTPGTVSKEYTDKIKNIGKKVEDLYTGINLNGKLRQVLDNLDDKKNLPSINPNWNLDDYIIVAHDFTEVEDGDSREPSTIYIVVPNFVTECDISQNYYYCTPDNDDYKSSVDLGNSNIGMLSSSDMLKKIVEHVDKEGKPDFLNDKQKSLIEKMIKDKRFRLPVIDVTVTYKYKLNQSDDGYYSYSNNHKLVYISTDVKGVTKPEYWKYYDNAGDVDKAFSDLHNYSLPTGIELNSYIGDDAISSFESTYRNYKGKPSYSPKSAYIDADYFLITTSGDPIYYDIPYEVIENNETKTKTETVSCKVDNRCYKIVTANQGNTWSQPIFLTSDLPYAQTDKIGGFKNVSDTDLDQGYVYRDDDGYLRLLDYSLLRSGVLAYQLGEDYEIPAGNSPEEIQTYLSEYINNRVAFPNSSQLLKASEYQTKLNSGNASQLYNPEEIITLTLYLPETNDEQSAYNVNIENIDSRFGTAFRVYLDGNCGSDVTVNFRNCEKLKIDINPNCNATINIINCNLWYDSSILNKAANISELTLWHKKLLDTDLDLIVQGMNVSRVSEPTITTNLEFWKQSSTSDVHYNLFLSSLSFSKEGEVIGGSIGIACSVTKFVDDNKPLIVSSEITLDEDNSFTYPKSKMNNMKISGQFLSSYDTSSDTDKSIMLIDTNFTFLINKNSDGNVKSYMNAKVEGSSLDGVELAATEPWATGRYNYFGSCIAYQ